MQLSKHDEVIEQLAAQRAGPSFGESVLPGRAWRNPELPNARFSIRASNSVPKMASGG
jgi:hypothetical protein